MGDYLNSKASLADRISLNGFGERDPVAINANVNGTDNPQGRCYNRRVELRFTDSPASLMIIKFRDIPENLLSK